MTVCIAAYSLVDQCIIAVSDMKLSTVEMSMDYASIKELGIGKNWVLQFAGNDISEMTPIVRNVRKLLHDISAEYSLDQITSALANAYRRQLLLKAETELLKPISYTFEDFKKQGYSQLGQENFSRILYSIQEQSLDLQFLVSEFEGDREHIFTVSSPGKVTYYSELGFWAIGSGQTNALGSFFNSGPPRYLNKYDLMYRSFEAKFNAESADGVGPTAIATILYRDGQKYPVLSNDIQQIKPFWEKTRVRKVPPEANTKAKEVMQKMEQKYNIKPLASETSAPAQ